MVFVVIHCTILFVMVNIVGKIVMVLVGVYYIIVVAESKAVA